MSSSSDSLSVSMLQTMYPSSPKILTSISSLPSIATEIPHYLKAHWIISVFWLAWAQAAPTHFVIKICCKKHQDCCADIALIWCACVQSDHTFKFPIITYIKRLNKACAASTMSVLHSLFSLLLISGVVCSLCTSAIRRLLCFWGEELSSHIGQ